MNMIAKAKTQWKNSKMEKIHAQANEYNILFDRYEKLMATFLNSQGSSTDIHYYSWQIVKLYKTPGFKSLIHEITRMRNETTKNELKALTEKGDLTQAQADRISSGWSL